MSDPQVAGTPQAGSTAIQHVRNLRYDAGRLLTPLRQCQWPLQTAGLLLALNSLVSLFAGEQAAARVTEAQGHAFACTDYSQGKVFLVTAEGKVAWEYQSAGCNDLWVLPNNNLLFNTGHGVREVTRERRVVFDYQSKSEIYACQRLTNGNTFIGECNAGRLLEVEPSGRIAKEIHLLPEGKDGGHTYMRNARRLNDGHYLVSHYGEQVVREYDSNGKIVRTIPAAGGPHSAIRLPNGNTLVACGDLPGGARAFEVDPSGTVVWQVQGNELPGLSLKFIGGLQRLPNGNTLLCNWLGHGHFGEGPHLVEVAADKRVVWTFADHPAIKTISSVQLLDVPGDAVRGQIMH